jgi:cellulose synthase/poly-beta-1,6-N-acetylglucosamine synthase-like glycosyltransferase
MRFVAVTFSMYVLASLVCLLDLIDLMVRLYLRRQQTSRLTPRQVPATSIALNLGPFTPYEVAQHLRPFALIASVHNAVGELERFVRFVEPFRAHLWVIDDKSSDDTAAQIQAKGIRCIRSGRNQQKPGALKMLMGVLPSTVETVVVLDPDARILTSRDEFTRVLFEFQRTGMAALCPRISAAGHSWLARIQRLEYWLAFSIGRKSLADFSITSGVAVYRADALRHVLAEHTLSVYAEDLENALILLARGDAIYYDGRLVVETDAVESVSHLFSQRVGWHYGLMKVYLERWRTLGRRARGNLGFAYQFLIYIGVFVLALHPLKILSLVVLTLSAVNGLDHLLGLHLVPDNRLTNALYFPIVYLEYFGLMLFASMMAVGRTEWPALFIIVPLYPLYSLAHVVPATIGYLNWFTERWWGRRLYRDHYQPS